MRAGDFRVRGKFITKRKKPALLSRSPRRKRFADYHARSNALVRCFASTSARGRCGTCKKPWVATKCASENSFMVASSRVFILRHPSSRLDFFARLTPRAISRGRQRSSKTISPKCFKVQTDEGRNLAFPPNKK